MVPIQQVQVGTVILLTSGCAAIRWIAHPTGAASLVLMQEACDSHRAERIEVRPLQGNRRESADESHPRIGTGGGSSSIV